MKTKSFFIAILALFMLMTACTSTSPSPTVEPTLTPTETPAPTPDPALLASPTQSEADYVKEVFKNDTYRTGMQIPMVNPRVGIKYNSVEDFQSDDRNENGYYSHCAEQYLDTAMNVDTTKLEADLISKKISTPDSEQSVYGGLFYDASLFESHNYYKYNLMLYFECKKDDAYPTWINIYSVDGGIMKLCVYYSITEWERYGDEDGQKPDNLLVRIPLVNINISRNYDDMVSKLDSIREIEVTYKTVYPYVAPEHVPYQGSPVAEFNDEEAEIIKALIDRTDDEDDVRKKSLPINESDSDVKAVKATDIWSSSSKVYHRLYDKVSDLGKIKITTHGSYIADYQGAFSHPVYGPIVFDESAIYGEGDSVFLVAYIDAAYINFYLNSCGDITLEDGCLNVKINITHSSGGDQMARPTIIVLEIEGCKAEDVKMADLRFVVEKGYY